MHFEQESEAYSKPGTKLDVTDKDGVRTTLFFPCEASRLAHRLRKDGMTATVSREQSHNIQRRQKQSIWFAVSSGLLGVLITGFVFIALFGWTEVPLEVRYEASDGNIEACIDYQWVLMNWKRPVHRTTRIDGRDYFVMHQKIILPEQEVRPFRGDLWPERQAQRAKLNQLKPKGPFDSHPPSEVANQPSINNQTPKP